MRFLSTFFSTTLLLSAAPLAGQAVGQPAEPRKTPVTDAEVMKVHKSALVIDGHNDFSIFGAAGRDIGKTTEGHLSTARIKAGGVHTMFFAAFQGTMGPTGWATAPTGSSKIVLERLDSIRHDVIERYPNDYMLVLKADDILAARKAGKIGVVMVVEGGLPLENSLRFLRVYHDLGARSVTIVHEKSHSFADSSGNTLTEGEVKNGGLTDFGKQVIHEMNRLGMIIDISHAADSTVWDVFKESNAPVIASHSDCRALAEQKRNMSDEILAALGTKGKGSVIEISFPCDMVSQYSLDIARKLGPNYKAWKTDKIPAIIAQIDHAVKLAGIDHVGIGSDYDGMDCGIDGLDDVSKFSNLTRALLERGYSEKDIHKILGGNTLRVMHAVEKAAASLKTTAAK